MVTHVRRSIGLQMRGWWELLAAEGETKWWRGMVIGGCVRHASLLSISRKCLMEADEISFFIFPFFCVLHFEQKNLLL